MRLFLAVNFNEEIMDALEETQALLQRRGLRGRYAPRSNLHLTLAFLGETTPDRVPPLRSLVRDLAGIPEALTAQGWFRLRQKKTELKYNIRQRKYRNLWRLKKPRKNRIPPMKLYSLRPQGKMKK